MSGNAGPEVWEVGGLVGRSQIWLSGKPEPQIWEVRVLIVVVFDIANSCLDSEVGRSQVWEFGIPTGNLGLRFGRIEC